MHSDNLNEMLPNAVLVLDFNFDWRTLHINLHESKVLLNYIFVILCYLKGMQDPYEGL